jgi:hypothetical protein
VGIRLEGPTSERIERLFKEEMKVSYMNSLRKISMEVKKRKHLVISSKERKYRIATQGQVTNYNDLEES